MGKVLGVALLGLCIWALKSEYQGRVIATVGLIAVIGFAVLSKKR